MKFLSVCSGIEAASVAWNPLGWKAAAFAEIEPFPCAVLAHHYPEVPNWGDMTKFQEWPDVPALDVLCGGTPCQSFSVAGLRAGLADPRGNLALTYLAIAARYRPRWLVWENVPGVFSSLSHDAPDQRPPDIDLDGGHGPADGEEVVVADEYDADESHAFGCLLAGLSELGYGWAYRVLDAQFFGVPQRRRRPFVVGYLGDWRRAAAVLFERHSMSGNPAPSRQAGKGLARPIAGSSPSSSGYRNDADTADNLVPELSMTLSACANAADLETFIPEIVGQAMSAKWSKGTAGPAGDEHHNLLAVPAFVPELAATMVARSSRGGGQTNSPDHQADRELIVTHALTGEGFDASEDGTGRGTPLVPIAIPLQEVGKRTGVSTTDPRAGLGIDNHGDPMYTLQAGAQHGVMAFSAKDHGADAMQDCSPTLRAGGHAGSHANAGVMPAIVFDPTQITSPENRSNPQSGDPCHTLAKGQQAPAVAYEAHAFDARQADVLQYGPITAPMDTGIPGPAALLGMQVRRLTPVECARLQGFPDDYLDIIFRGKPAHDGPKYKALGNSWAVPCARWIGERIAKVDSLMSERLAA